MSQENDNVHVDINFNLPPLSLYREYLQPQATPEHDAGSPLLSGHSVDSFKTEVERVYTGTLLLAYVEEVAKVHTHLNPLSTLDLVQRFRDEAGELSSALSEGYFDWEVLDELADVLFFLIRAAMLRKISFNQVVSYGTAKVHSRNTEGKNKWKEWQLAQLFAAHPR